MTAKKTSNDEKKTAQKKPATKKTSAKKAPAKAQKAVASQKAPAKTKKAAPKKEAKEPKTKKAPKSKAPLKIEENIVLIGFMGAGKGATARELAKQTGVFAIDCDDMIESFANKKIKKIFEEGGEAAFRVVESSLATFLEHSVKGAIISTGGGFFAVSNLNKIGRVVYLKRDFEHIIARLKSAKNSKKKFAKRPLLSNLKKARELYAARESEYAKKADIIIECGTKNEKQIAAAIIKIIKEKH